MKTLLILLFCLPGIGSAAELYGDWKYDGFFFDGHRYEKPDPNLQLTFTFFEDQTERLNWKRDSEFCERRGTWELKNDILIQTVTWLNPENSPSCTKDPDMQMGRVTQNRIDVQEKQLNIYMDLNGKEFIYILIR